MIRCTNCPHLTLTFVVGADKSDRLGIDQDGYESFLWQLFDEQVDSVWVGLKNGLQIDRIYCSTTSSGSIVAIDG
jgi:hypothetical protein